MRSFEGALAERGGIFAAALLIAGALSGLAYFLAVGPLLDARQQHQALLRELDLQRDQAAKLEVSLKTLKRQLSSATQELSAIPLRLQPLDSLNRRLALITALAAEWQLKLDEMQPAAPIERPLYRIVPIRIAGAGMYPAWVSFLHQLHQSFPDVAVASLDINRLGASSEASVHVRIELLWHAMPVQPGLPGDGRRLTAGETNRLLQE